MVWRTEVLRPKVCPQTPIYGISIHHFNFKLIRKIKSLRGSIMWLKYYKPQSKTLTATFFCHFSTKIRSKFWPSNLLQMHYSYLILLNLTQVFLTTTLDYFTILHHIKAHPKASFFFNFWKNYLTHILPFRPHPICCFYRSSIKYAKELNSYRQLML